MAPLSEWLELMLAEIARRQEEAQLNAEEEARRVREALAAAAVSSAVQSAPPAATTLPADAANVPQAVEPGARRRRRG